MGLFSYLFGKKVVEVEKAEPVIIEEAPKPKPKPIDTRTEEEKIIDGFQLQIDTSGKAVEKARQTLYDQKAQLGAKRKILKLLGKEIESHKQQLAVEEQRLLDANDEEAYEIEIAGQKLQNTILMKSNTFESQDSSLLQLQSTIDVLERTIIHQDMEVARKRSDLDSVRTAAAVLGLSRDVQQSLPSEDFHVDSKALGVYLERQSLQLADLSAEATSTAFTDSTNALALPFKQRVTRTAEEEKPKTSTKAKPKAKTKTKPKVKPVVEPIVEEALVGELLDEEIS